jgi:ribosomal protein S18 acetylase RimI-like enzyme
VPLDERYDRSTFSSGVEPLDRYFRTQAGQDLRKRVASCFVLIRAGEPTPIGFYTLAATSIVLSDLPVVVTKRLPRYPLVPATLMGRLAVDAGQRRKGLGQMLLFDAFSRTLRSDIATFAIVVDAKDDGAAAFYELHGFRPLMTTGRRMFAPTADVAKLFA